MSSVTSTISTSTQNQAGCGCIFTCYSINGESEAGRSLQAFIVLARVTKKVFLPKEDTAQRLRAHIALPEDPSSIPSTYVRWLIIICNSSYRGIQHLGSLWAPAFTYTYPQTDRQTHIHLKIIKLIFKKPRRTKTNPPPKSWKPTPSEIILWLQKPSLVWRVGRGKPGL